MSDEKWQMLEKILSPQFREQLSGIILKVLAEGFGTVSIEIKDHEPRVLYEERSILVIKPSNN